MSKYCPVRKERVIYLTCQECEDKVCRKRASNQYDSVESLQEKVKQKILTEWDLSMKAWSRLTPKQLLNVVEEITLKDTIKTFLLGSLCTCEQAKLKKLLKMQEILNEFYETCLNQDVLDSYDHAVEHMIQAKL